MRPYGGEFKLAQFKIYGYYSWATVMCKPAVLSGCQCDQCCARKGVSRPALSLWLAPGPIVPCDLILGARAQEKGA
jgi:hypothetical protein